MLAEKNYYWVTDKQIVDEFPELTVREVAMSCYMVASQARDWSSPWTVAMFEQTILLPATRFIFLYEEDEMIGFLIGRTVGNECDIYFVAVVSQMQGQGLGQELVRRFLVDQYDRGIRHFFLEVRVSNEAALRVYQKWQFSVDDRIKNYYKNPSEDAYRMSLHFK